MKTGNGRLFQIKAPNPVTMQKWVEHLQNELTVTSPSASFSYCAIVMNRKRKNLHLDTEAVNEEVAPPTLSSSVLPTPIGKRDFDIPASTLRQKVLNKQGKDYSSESATTIQREYIATKSTREAIMEAHKHSLSAKNVLEAEEQSGSRPPDSKTEASTQGGMTNLSSRTRQLLVDNNAASKNARRKSLDEGFNPKKIPVVMATPSLFSRSFISFSSIEAFDLLEMSKKQRRALSTGSSLADMFHSMQFFNPEFDPATEEAEPAPIRSILHERFLEALDASIYEDTNETVLVLDKVSKRVFHYK